MDDQDIIDLLELQRLTRELLDHVTAMFPVEEAAGLQPCRFRQFERRILRTRGESFRAAGAISRSMSAKMGLEFGFVAD